MRRMKPPAPATPHLPPGAAPEQAPDTAPGAALDSGAAPLSESELDELQALIDSLPDDRDALDASMIDGYLCGLLLQPRPLAESAWLLRITDLDGRAPPRGFNLARLQALVQRRYRALHGAISRREWFDPWVFAGDEADSPSETVLPWVAGFAAAVDHFTNLMDQHEDDLLEPLALLYRHLDPDDLEDADALLAEIETYEPAATLDEAVEDLVRAVMLMADVSRPQVSAAPVRRPSAKRAPGRGRPGGHAGAFNNPRPRNAAGSPAAPGGPSRTKRRP